MDTISDSNWTRWKNVEYEPKFHQYWFENVDIDFWYDFADSYMYSIIVLAVSLYLLGVWKLSKFMKGRSPYQLRSFLFCWNILVGTFSIMALYRISSEVMIVASKPQGLYRSLCLREGLHSSTAFWAVALCWSKPAFMFDTMFLILRKKPVDAIHLIHHTLAIIFAPLLVVIAEPVLRWIGMANLFVHAIDYPILALTSVQIRIPMARQFMAALEIVQMIFVLVLSAYTLILNATGSYCMRHPRSVMITYAVYFGLLLILIVTLLSPDYWKRGIRKIKRASIIDRTKSE